MTDCDRRSFCRPASARLLSAEWFDILEEEAQRLCREAELTDASFVLVEAYPGAPQAPEVYGGRAPGYRLEIRGSNAVLVRGVGEHETGADVVVSLDHSILAEVVCEPIGPGLERLTAVYSERRLISVTGAFDAAPIDLARLHDAMQSRTLV
jgi:hypothetical protein